MFWKQGLAFILGITVWLLASPAWADWTHPMSFSNAELAREHK
ncbi:hypothetical protein [Nodularia spumigena]|jgi:hypothetical protein|nr:hypothetical protein NSP_36970 [Nodularia spumigena CCY9414]EAW44885.1 hypothetical protein N9414_20019 [Nodularia spumigena CCY9414]